MDKPVEVSDTKSINSSIPVACSKIYCKPEDLRSGSYLSNLIDQIGFNKYTILSCLVLALVTFMNGADLIFLVILWKSLSKSYGYPLSLFSILLSVINLCFCFSSLSICFLASRWGRICTIKASLVLYLICALMCSIVLDYWAVFVFRCVCSACLGILINLSKTLLMEYLPTRRRGLYFSLIINIQNLGALYTIILNLLVESNDPVMNFRLVNTYLRIPGIFLLFVLLFAKDSLFSMFLSQNFEEGYRTLEEVCQGKGITIDDQAKEKLKEDIQHCKGDNKGSIKGLFTDQRWRLTIPLIIITLMGSILINCQLVIPITLEEWKGMTLNLPPSSQLLIYTLVVLPAGVVSGSITQIKSLSRKGSIIVCSFFSILVLISIVLYRYIYPVQMGFVIFIGKVQFTFIDLFQLESYPSRYRDSATGFIRFAVMLVSSFTPFIIYLIANPAVISYYVFIGMNAVIITFTFLLNKDSKDKKLEY